MAALSYNSRLLTFKMEKQFMCRHKSGEGGLGQNWKEGNRGCAGLQHFIFDSTTGVPGKLLLTLQW